jgi:hypothetical protein
VFEVCSCKSQRLAAARRLAAEWLRLGGSSMIGESVVVT